MPKNEFLPFGTAANANVLTNADYQALPARSGGFSSGVAKSEELNKAWRQGTVMAAAVGQFIADKTGQDVLDDGNVPALQAGLQAAMIAQTPGRLLNVQVITTSGVYIPVAGTKFVIVEAIGAGGGGGGCPATSTGQISYGNGGTSGTYGKSIFRTGFSGVPVLIGAAGSAALGATGGAGGSTSFGSLLICPGGAGGGARGPVAPPIGLGGAAASGSPATGANIVSVGGSPGEAGFAVSTVIVVSGLGGNSFFGGPTARNVVGASPAAAYNYGAGGTGAFTGELTSAIAGGVGGKGVVIVWEYA
ncbi:MULTISPECIES: hypothetical protein [unclassified Serratia (in: enterobacteria)]|uniref:hypothetical protein n=1 Tax=unclassified Serratia (in: enterobacteria) TaxID=2647522 RepID=UPI00046874C4|nr:MULTISPECIES: hypothetical protein [unclassified Serratia (in: enterobacteria)]